MSVNSTAICYDYNDIINNGGLVNNNNDGTVSVFVKNNVGALIPVPLTLKCCNQLQLTKPLIGTGGGYYWDGRDQQCKWNAFNPNQNTNLCTFDNPFNLLLNPDGNDGAIFNVGPQSNPSLTINFDYLFKFKCETLYGILNSSPTGSPSQSQTGGVIQVQAFQGSTTVEMRTANGVQIFNPITFNFTSGSANSLENLINNNLVNGFTIGNVTKPSTARFSFVITAPTILIHNGLTQLIGGAGVIGALSTMSIQGGTAPSLNPPPADCDTPAEALGKLDVSMTLDIVNNDNSSTTVYQQKIFNQIGGNGLFSYLNTHPNNSGFYICGDPVNGDPVSLTACTPMTNASSNQNVFSCNNLLNNIKTSIGNNIPVNSFNSNWLNFNTVITNQSILDLIKNKKIRLGLTVNEACIDFCVLVDNIELSTNTSSIENTNIFITQSPGFKLDRVRDNKKSWVNNTTPEERTFSISRNDGSNSIRLTDYVVNDERLVLNSKEIDLDVSLASAVETDVWGYILDNPCLLSATTAPCGCVSGSTGTTCCGDSSVDYNELITQPLTSVTTVEDFQYLLTSELIDAKDRKTLSRYPTLRGLYDRYLNSSAYCSQISSAFDYQKMEEFSNLVGNYWVDIIEQVVPSTTIWGATKIYSNTIFDGQKFKYKSYTLLGGTNPFAGITVLSPVSGTSTGVDVTATIITNTGNTTTDTFTNPYLIQMNSGSEFIGTVSIIGGSGNQSSSQNGQTLFAG